MSTEATAAELLSQLADLEYQSHEALLEQLVSEGRVVRNVDRSITYHLDAPIDTGEVLLESLTFRRPSVGDLRVVDACTSERQANLELIERCGFSMALSKRDQRQIRVEMVRSIVDQIDGSELAALEVVVRYPLLRIRSTQIGKIASVS